MILMNDFTAEPSSINEAMLLAAKKVIDSGWYILGNEVVRFEQNWSGVCGVTHGIGVGNGMDAIEIILRALDIGSGDEVITTPMTAFATVLAILRAGATPVLADIDLDTALLSMESVQRCLSPRTRAVVLVHLYGQVRNMDGWQNFCAAHGIQLIEDCAQAHLSSWRGKVAGSFGVAGAYSFYPTKNLGAAGDGGMIVTSDDKLAECARSLRNYGQSARYHHPLVGLNSRLDELHAAMLSARLEWLSAYTARRREIASAYRKGITNPSVKQLVAPEERDAHVYHLYVITCASRDGLQQHLLKHQIQTLIHYPIPVHKQESCLMVKHDPSGLGRSERYAATCLSLPCHPQMTNDDVATVIDAVNSYREA
jgi:dTDP-4-amino-4,6-dideoxygalactose transaminase